MNYTKTAVYDDPDHYARRCATPYGQTYHRGRILTVVRIVALTLVQLGADTDATVSVGFVMTFGITIGVIISTLLTGGLTYRSAR